MKAVKKERGVLRVLTIIIIAYWIVFGFNGLFRYGERIYYPLKYKEEIYSSAKSYDISRELVFATAKVESGFDKNAVSPKGAKGLMQIRDATADFIAEKVGVVSYDLFDPKTNIEFGCYYLKYLLNKFENTETAICAYNAGEGNVSLWLIDKNCSDDGKTLKNVPFEETANYRDKILKTFEKYKKLYGNILDK